MTRSIQPRSLAWMAAVVLLVVVGATAAYLAATERGATRSLCGITAYVVAPEERALALPPDFLRAHPALGEAMGRATSTNPGYAPVDSCEVGESYASDLEAAGAPRADDGFLVRHEGQTYRVGLSAGVA